MAEALGPALASSSGLSCPPHELGKSLDLSEFQFPVCKRKVAMPVVISHRLALRLRLGDGSSALCEL